MSIFRSIHRLFDELPFFTFSPPRITIIVISKSSICRRSGGRRAEINRGEQSRPRWIFAIRVPRTVQKVVVADRKTFMPIVSLANHFATVRWPLHRWLLPFPSSSFFLLEKRENRCLIDIRCFWHSRFALPFPLFPTNGAVNFFANVLHVSLSLYIYIYLSTLPLLFSQERILSSEIVDNGETELMRYLFIFCLFVKDASLIFNVRNESRYECNFASRSRNAEDNGGRTEYLLFS